MIGRAFNGQSVSGVNGVASLASLPCLPAKVPGNHQFFSENCQHLSRSCSPELEYNQKTGEKTYHLMANSKEYFHPPMVSGPIQNGRVD